MDCEKDVINIIAKVLEVSPELINEETAIGDIQEWDSLRHLIIISELEKEFQISFEPEEIMDLEDVSDIVAAINERKGVI